MNRLANETSPYLLQHKDNPVDWYPWGDEALGRAREENKPLLVSIGYSACHWCHVMERESFEDRTTAAVMNESFVCIKVDREERPGRRRDLHGRRAGDDRPRRLAAERVPHTRRRAVLRRYVLPARAAPGHAELAQRARRDRPTRGRRSARRSSTARRDHPPPTGDGRARAPDAELAPAALDGASPRSSAATTPSTAVGAPRPSSLRVDDRVPAAARRA